MKRLSLHGNEFGWASRLAACGIALALAGAVSAAGIPEKKRSNAGLYLTAVEASELLADPNVVFIDVRSRAEVSFLGLPTRANVNIPYMVMPMMAEFDAEHGSYGLEINPDFPTAFEAWVKEHGQSKDTTFVLMCRSGSRSAKAASLLFDMGFTNTYTVIDGYEGDKAKQGEHAGQRVVNGWRNAGLDWSYEIKLSQAYPSDLN